MSSKSRSYGGKIGFGIFHLLIKLFGPLPAYLLLALILPYYLFIRKSARQSASYYLKHMFPGKGKIGQLICSWQHLFTFGQVLIDQAAMGFLKKEKFRVSFPDQKRLYELSKRKKGMVLLTTHAGYWRTAMATMEHLSVPVNLLFEVENDEGMHFFDLSNQRERFKIISPKGLMGGLVEATNALNSGEIVAIMGDRAWGAKTEKIMFLGEEAPFPITPYYLAIATGSDLVMLLTARQGTLSYSIEFNCLTEDLDLSNLSKKKAIQNLTHRYVERLNKYLKKNPFMWYNFFDFWSTKNREKQDRVT